MFIGSCFLMNYAAENNKKGSATYLRPPCLTMKDVVPMSTKVFTHNPQKQINYHLYGYHELREKKNK